jgi:hypothetical protein
MDFSQGQVRVTTLPAHRVLWLAGQQGVQDAVGEALFRAHFAMARTWPIPTCWPRPVRPAAWTVPASRRCWLRPRPGRGRSRAGAGPCTGHFLGADLRHRRMYAVPGRSRRRPSPGADTDRGRTGAGSGSPTRPAARTAARSECRQRCGKRPGHRDLRQCPAFCDNAAAPCARCGDRPCC